LLYESGGRISEVLDLTIGDVKFDEYGAILKVNGKTGERNIRIIKSVGELKNWLNNHPFKNDINSPLLCNFHHKKYGQFLNAGSAWGMLKKIAKRAKIGRNIHPHMFRHKRCKDISGMLSDRELTIYFGWSPNSKMPAHYSHLTEKDVDNKILTINGIKNIQRNSSQLPTKKCYNCGENNNISNMFCYKCAEPLSEEGMMMRFVGKIIPIIFEKMKEREIDFKDLNELNKIIEGVYNKKVK
jgi:hypothetical protein